MLEQQAHELSLSQLQLQSAKDRIARMEAELQGLACVRAVPGPGHARSAPRSAAPSSTSADVTLRLRDHVAAIMSPGPAAPAPPHHQRR